MEYRGKSYTLVQGVDPLTWKWTIQLEGEETKSGTNKTRDAALTSVVMTIDKILAPKKTGSHRRPTCGLF